MLHFVLPYGVVSHLFGALMSPGKAQTLDLGGFG
jgi:hypothetical protein